MATLEGADPTFAANVNALIRASGGRVYLKSGVRTNARQTELWNAALKTYGSAAAARKWVAPPGRSNHEKGLAVDLGGDLELAARLAPQFGLHRPLANEDWHFEPIGSRAKRSALGIPKNMAASQQLQAVIAPPAPAAPAATTTTAPAAPDDRRSLDVQISSFLAILDKPIDFTSQEVA